MKQCAQEARLGLHSKRDAGSERLKLQKKEGPEIKRLEAHNTAPKKDKSK